MTSWFSRVRAPKPTVEQSHRLNFSDDLWSKCKGCSAIIYTKDLVANQSVCSKCGYHFRLSSDQRIALLSDEGSFVEEGNELKSNDPLAFRDSSRYRDRLKKSQKATGHMDGLRLGKAAIGGAPISLAVFNFRFMGGSMGMVVGEKLAQAFEIGLRDNIPVVIVSSSGGARMQEGIFSLMQMAKVSATRSKLSRQGLPFISILTDPTTGGVAASFAMQGDLNIAEPGALIGFAGPRVIEQTIRKTLPEGFQSAEFLLEHGMLDKVVHRHSLKSELTKIIAHLVVSS